MNGHTFLRSYRVLMLLGMLSFMGTAYIYTIPEDYLTEEYVFLTQSNYPRLPEE